MSGLARRGWPQGVAAAVTLGLLACWSGSAAAQFVPNTIVLPGFGGAVVNGPVLAGPVLTGPIIGPPIILGGCGPAYLGGYGVGYHRPFGCGFGRRSFCSPYLGWGSGYGGSTWGGFGSRVSVGGFWTAGVIHEEPVWAGAAYDPIPPQVVPWYVGETATPRIPRRREPAIAGWAQSRLEDQSRLPTYQVVGGIDLPGAATRVDQSRVGSVPSNQGVDLAELKMIVRRPSFDEPQTEIAAAPRFPAYTGQNTP